MLRIPQTFELIGVEQHGGMLCSDRLSEVLDIALSDVAGRNTGVAEVRALPVILSHQYPDLIISDAINHGTGKTFIWKPNQPLDQGAPIAGCYSMSMPASRLNSATNLAAPPIGAVETLHIASAQRLEYFADRLPAFRRCQQMNVVGHPDIGVHRQTLRVGRLDQRIAKKLIVLLSAAKTACRLLPR